MAWVLANGRDIPDGHFACHRCDNPACVRPDHLFVGTQIDNMQDACKKGRMVGVGGVGPRKITSLDVIDIRKRFEDGELQHQIAKLYKISRVNVSAICTRKSWKHVS